MLRGSWLGHRAVVVPLYHVTLPYFPGQNRLVQVGACDPIGWGSLRR